MMREIIEEESLIEEEIKKLSPFTSQYMIPCNQAQKSLDSDTPYWLDNDVAEINTQRQTQTSRYGLEP